MVIGFAIRRLESFADSPFPLNPTQSVYTSHVDGPVWRFHSGDSVGNGLVPLEIGFERGQTIGQVLEGYGLEPWEAQGLITQLARHTDLRRLRPDDRYATIAGPSGAQDGFQLTLAGEGRVKVERSATDWTSSWHPFRRSASLSRVSGELVGSLEESIRRAGGESILAYEMADVLQWDLDFNRDLRAGDTFDVLYEVQYLDGAYDSVGAVHALSYNNAGRVMEAYRFGEDGGYYDAEGRPLKKLFLRSPMRYSRVTSGFSARRFHPILKTYRPHYGVDYGAPTGTPARVTANGVVTFAGWDRGGGKTVKVRHPNNFLTAYLHLSRFAKGISPGRRVAQGEVIGYVGATGLATAPHLDYRVQQNGRWINPLALKSEPAEPIPEERKPDFDLWRERLQLALFEGAPLDLLLSEGAARTAAVRHLDIAAGSLPGAR